MRKWLWTVVVVIGMLILFAAGCGTKNPVSFSGTSKGDTLAIQAIMAANGLPDTVTIRKISDWSGNRIIGLRLARRNITVLPKEFGELTALLQLSAANNALTTLPSEIGNLKKLRVIDVASNQLTSLPAAIGDCDSLRSLLLQNNRLATLPSTIVNLDSLDDIFVENNHLVNLPTAIKDFISSKSMGDSAWIATQTP